MEHRAGLCDQDRTEYGVGGFSENTNRHRPVPFEGDRARCFESGRVNSLKLCQESIPAALTATRAQWAATPKLTMIAGRQFSIGSPPVWSALLDFTITETSVSAPAAQID